MPHAAPPAVEGVIQVCAHVLDIELTGVIPDIQRTTADGRSAGRAWAVVRLYGEPLGAVDLEIPAAGLTGAMVGEILLGRLLPRVRQATGNGQLAADPQAVLDALRSMGGTAFSRAHNEFATRAPRCSVVICTRDRPADLHRCLSSLTKQDHRDFAVWVIDNTAGDELTRKTVESFADELDLRYVVAPRPGLSRARNAALREDLEGDIVAWIDDDEIVDPLWLTELMRAFDEHPEAVAASGLVVPAELDTSAQVWYEQFGGHSKGRGFTPAVFSPATWGRQHPLYPLPPFGVGANMAFRTAALVEIGGFDEALGAGTLAQGAEDTKVFTDLLLAGGTCVYWPTASTAHFHRREFSALRRQMYGYGTGLTAFYIAELLARPATAWDLVRLAPRALHDIFASDSPRVATVEDDFPRELLALHRRGMAAGPWRYVRSRFSNWREDRRN